MAKKILNQDELDRFEQRLLFLGSDKTDSREFFDNIDIVVESLKSEMQGTGFLKKCKAQRKGNQENEERVVYLATFVKHEFDDLDEKVNVYATSMYVIKKKASFDLHYNIFATLADEQLVADFPYLKLTLAVLNGNQISNEGRDRIRAIISEVASQSNRQSNVSNAGKVGEKIMKGILEVAGGVEGIHFEEQVRSKSSDDKQVGSITDFVIPHSSRIRIMPLVRIAAQFSTNDRLRLISSELSGGSQRVWFTGNGLEASSKKLNSVSEDGFRDLLRENIVMVCYRPEIDFEIDRLLTLGNPKDADRISYLKDVAKGIEQYARITSDMMRQWD